MTLKADQLIQLYRAGVLHRDEVEPLMHDALLSQPESLHLAVNERLVSAEYARTFLGLSESYRPGPMYNWETTVPKFPPPPEPPAPPES